MLGRVLETLAPEPSLFAKFAYNWKHVKNFYQNPTEKSSVDDTNIPFYLEQILNILVQEQSADKAEESGERCIDFVLENNALDMLVDLAISDNPVGIREWVFKWMRRYLTCLENPVIAHGSVFKPLLKLQAICNGANASAYENSEVLFLEAIAGNSPPVLTLPLSRISQIPGIIGKTPEYIKFFLPQHRFSDSTTKGIFTTKPPKDNQLFTPAIVQLEPNIRRISLMVSDDEEAANIVEERAVEEFKERMSTPRKILKNCNCDEEDRFHLFHAIMSYLESADSEIVVRACEAILILVSLKELKDHCLAVNAAFIELSHIMGEKLSVCAELIPVMDLGDIEDCTVNWGLFPKDDQGHYIGRFQLTSFLCWLDFSDCLAKENLLVADILGELFRENTLEKIVEPNLFEICPSFGLVLTAKIVKQLRSESMMEEIATWLVGTEINGTDCLLNILIENAHDSQDVIQILQLVEALLDNPNERVLHSMLFIYVNNRGYLDQTKIRDIESLPLDEVGQEKMRDSFNTVMKSRTMAPSNILKVINNFLLLLPSEVKADSVGTCYEE